MNPGRSALVDACRSSLEIWEAPDSDQHALRSEFLGFIDRHPGDAWSRGHDGAHLTASALICSPSADRVLLTLHRRLGRWLQTGGHIESTDPSLEAAARREAQEESGLADLEQSGTVLLLSSHRLSCGPAADCVHLDVQFLLLADPHAPLTRSAESTALGWFDVDELPDTDDSVRALVRAARHRLGAGS